MTDDERQAMEWLEAMGIALRCPQCATNGTIKVLPHNQSRLGQGLAGSCSVCQEPISPDDTVYEVVGGAQPPAYAHPTCHRVWWIESMARETQS